MVIEDKITIGLNKRREQFIEKIVKIADAELSLKEQESIRKLLEK